MDYSYFEPTEALQNRIFAHQKYSSFSLEDFLTSNFNYSSKNILDVGCGNGNFTKIFASESSLYVGIEKNKESITTAYEDNNESKNVLFHQLDMDSDFLLPKNSFDYIFFVFSVYYTNDPKALFEKLYKLLKPGGELVLIGPTVNNAKELDIFCQKAFNAESPSYERAVRIENEFVPIMKETGYECSIQTERFDIKFPDHDEYMKYILSTLQYRNSFNGEMKIDSEKILVEEFNLTLTKDIIIACGKK